MKQIKPLHAGFTLFELLITVAIATILIGVAVPSFTSMSKSNKMTSTVNELVYSLNITRSEAMKSNRASICVSSDQATCAATGSWQSGWIVFSDLDGDCTVDAGENLIKAVESIKSPNTIVVAPAARLCVTYAGNGFITPPANAPTTFTFCDGRTGTTVGRTITVIITGRPTTVASNC